MDSTFIDFMGAGGDNEDNDKAIALEESEDKAQDKAVPLSKSDPTVNGSCQLLQLAKDVSDILEGDKYIS